MKNKSKIGVTQRTMPFTSRKGTSKARSALGVPSIHLGGFPPNVPEKLIIFFHQENDNFSALARRLKVTPALVWKLLVKGIEPKEKELRLKLFLKAKYRKPLPPRVNEAVDILSDLESKAIRDKKQKHIFGRGGKLIR